MAPNGPNNFDDFSGSVSLSESRDILAIAMPGNDNENGLDSCTVNTYQKNETHSLGCSLIGNGIKGERAGGGGCWGLRPPISLSANGHIVTPLAQQEMMIMLCLLEL